MGPRSNSGARARTQQSKPLGTKRKLSLAALAAAVALTAGTVAWWMASQPAATPAPPNGPEGMAWVPGGKFLMGSDHKLAQDNERPAHRVKVEGFWMDRHHVTNAEKKPDWETMISHQGDRCCALAHRRDALGMTWQHL